MNKAVKNIGKVAIVIGVYLYGMYNGMNLLAVNEIMNKRYRSADRVIAAIHEYWGKHSIMADAATEAIVWAANFTNWVVDDPERVKVKKSK